MIDISQAATYSLWNRIGIKHHHGLVLPLFSLHSTHSMGIGEYPDLLPMIDWCQSVGMDVIQLLPLNDTGFGDSPYSALSANALNPIHLGLRSLPFLEKHPDLLLRIKLCSIESIDNRVHYAAVREAKSRYLEEYILLVKDEICSGKQYNDFIEKSQWLEPYAIYKTLKTIFHHLPWEQWPEKYFYPSKHLFDEVKDKHRTMVERFCIEQYLCHLQMSSVKTYADEHQILLMGDIPILIDRDSSDVWAERALFDLHYAAGSPPDQFAVDGQYWGFPIYRWDKLAKQDYQWWTDRLKNASQYYHLYRIDHIVGFYRVWAIPYGHKGYEGHFLPKDISKWIPTGQAILERMINASDMLPIGEDLGVVSEQIRQNMRDLGIAGTRVMRWEREWNEHKQPFIPVSDYAPLTMTTVSTHDSETLQQWWRDYPDEGRMYADTKGWCYQEVLSRENHRDILWESHHGQSLFHINLLQEYLALIPGLTSHCIDDERINRPGTVSERNWSYRFIPSIEEIVSNETLTLMIKDLII